jgi:hypothetical protein
LSTEREAIEVLRSLPSELQVVPALCSVERQWCVFEYAAAMFNPSASEVFWELLGRLWRAVAEADFDSSQVSGEWLKRLLFPRSTSRWSARGRSAAVGLDFARRAVLEEDDRIHHTWRSLECAQETVYNFALERLARQSEGVTRIGRAMTPEEYLVRQAEEEREVCSDPLLLREEARQTRDARVIAARGFAAIAELRAMARADAVEFLPLPKRGTS